MYVHTYGHSTFTLLLIVLYNTIGQCLRNPLAPSNAASLSASLYTQLLSPLILTTLSITPHTTVSRFLILHQT